MKNPANSNYLKKSSGQAVLLVILGMAVVLTIVLSVVSRTVTDVSISEVEENSSKAFSAAEAGIERLLIGETNISGEQLGNNALIESAQALPLGEGLDHFDFTDTYNNGDVANIWFVSHTDDGKNLTCSPPTKPCFGGNSFKLLWNEDAAIEVSVYYDPTGNSLSSTPSFSGVRVKRFAFDPNSSRRGNNNFSATDIGEDDYSHSSGDISLSGLTNPLFARVRFLYESSFGFGVKVPSGTTLPSQGRLLISRGSAEGATRQVEVHDYYRSPVGIFEAGLVSPGSLSK
jgi:hypothetical protein